MEEGEFFGEISLLTGKPRTATVTAAGPVELLELDRATLDDISSRHPRVRAVVEEFAEKRSGSERERLARVTG
jgi:CRP-like cAMP-binding protein